MGVKIRRESHSDLDAIDALIIMAFLHASHTSHTEQFIVNALREAGQLSVSLVAEANGEIVGHVAVSPVSISGGTHHWYGLGPISVAPEWQHQGVGAQLIKQALTELRELGAAGCVVLGEPQYYARFGFKVEPALILPEVSPAYFHAISFAVRVPSGTVSYHEAFNV